MSTTERTHDFDEFMSRLPQWAQGHVHDLKDQIRQLQQRLEHHTRELSKESEGATIWLKRGGHLDPDLPLNGGEEKYPGARNYVAVRFSPDGDRQYAGIQVRWVEKRYNDDKWLEIRGNHELEFRMSAANTLYVREVER